MDIQGWIDAYLDHLRVERARLLSNGALADMAVRELQAAASQEGGTWAPPEMARVYQDGGRYDRGIEIMKRATPNYFAVDIPDLPRPYWEALFPRPYWNDLKRYSYASGLDPYLVASLIRQESEFNPTVVSYANAYGLMQLLPSVGKAMAKEAGRRYATAAAFAEDLRRWLKGEAILARPVGRLERIAKWTRRNPALAACLATIASLRAFDVIFALTQGGPLNSTNVLPLLSFQTSFQEFDFGRGAAIGSFAFLIVFAVALLYVRVLRSEQPT